jgi:hypothetical protein
MTKVFIGGSRAVFRLNSTIREKLDDFIGRQCAILIGDANGADKAVQEHLADHRYQHVLVYCMDRCRNNLGNWPIQHVQAPGTRKDFAYYAAKDLAMARDANCGVMLWDGKSKGTLNNVQQLLSQGKKTLVYLASEKAFHKLTTVQDMEELLGRCDSDSVQEAQRQIRAKLPVLGQLPLYVPPA